MNELLPGDGCPMPNTEKSGREWPTATADNPFNESPNGIRIISGFLLGLAGSAIEPDKGFLPTA